LQIKVIDRTGLILEIFAARAQTKEGTLQVEMAMLEYQRSRLVRLWTHLERQRGGGGFMGGPGETQKELDRRIIRDKMIRLKKELEDVRRTRALGRKARERVPFPVAALVGYTNAGKSTLFNRITKAEVFVKDLLFATLDPTMRRIKLKNGQSVIMSDTVGFISDLPTHLVEAFRATLEQINHADVILHVIDVSQPDSRSQRTDVIQILSDLGIDYETEERIVEVWNKIDNLPDEALEDIRRDAKFRHAMPVSALTGEGIETLLEKIAAMTGKERVNITFVIDITDGKALAWLHQHAQVLERKDRKATIKVSVTIEPRDIEKFTERFGYKADILDT
jgi:GTP-binding protein HflX